MNSHWWTSKTTQKNNPKQKLSEQVRPEASLDNSDGSEGTARSRTGKSCTSEKGPWLSPGRDAPRPMCMGAPMRVPGEGGPGNEGLLVPADICNDCNEMFQSSDGECRI